MTVEEFLAIPDDGIERMLIDGVVREIGTTIQISSLSRRTCLSRPACCSRSATRSRFV
jgi:hypothetical protein